MKRHKAFVKKIRRTAGRFCFLLFSSILVLAVCSTVSVAEMPQKTFSSAEEAVKAFVAAVRADDTKEMAVILGPGSREIISSGDNVADKSEREKFINAYDKIHALTQGSEKEYMILQIGPDNWPMPVPVVKKGEKWGFDISRGKQEILNRRIGRNELKVIDVMHAYVDAQHEYATRDCGGEGKVEFAQRLVSAPGKQDGLYWDVKEGEEPSPLGPLVAQAAKEGYAGKKQAMFLSPFHGYYYKILKGQGKNASGGQFEYVVKGKMILGFSLIAYPAEYGNSGVMTFIVNQKGTIYEKNIGKDTKRMAENMKKFDPDKTWKQVKETTKND